MHRRYFNSYSSFAYNLAFYSPYYHSHHRTYCQIARREDFYYGLPALYSVTECQDRHGRWYVLDDSWRFEFYLYG